MNILNPFKPKPTLSDQERATGLRMLTWQAVLGSSADGLASGGFLAAFALILGASNLHIGMMTAIPFIMQPIQIAAVVIVERLRLRKIIAVSAYFVAYSTWVPVAFIPFVIDVPNAGAVSLLLVFTAIRGTANAFVSTSWNGWLRDIVPQNIMGNYFSQRMRVATIAAAVTGMLAAFYIDFWKSSVSEQNVVYGYSIAMVLGSVLLGWSAVGFMSRIPEPMMVAPEGRRPSIRKTLSAPLGDQDFRLLMGFLFLWNFTIYLAVPFFTVYMLVRLELPLSVVVGLGVLSQITNVLFLRVWGPFVDQYGSKVVLSLSSSLYLLVILGWTFTTMPNKYVLTLPLLVVLHALVGIASAGINISSTTIRMKMSPQAHSTAYLTGASLAANLGAGISPLLGGLFADFFRVRHFQISFEWVDPTRTIDFPGVFLTGFDFLFAVAFIFGIFTLNILTRIRKEGEVDSQVVLDELMAQTRDNLRVLNSVRGLSLVSHFPYSGMRYVPHFPGLDVAFGVTAYQLASSTRTAVETVSRGRAAGHNVAVRVRHVVASAVVNLEDLGKHGIEVALHATRGAIHAAGMAELGVEHIASQAVVGALKALAKTSVDPWDALWGVGYGSIRGADEAGENLGEVATHAVEGARQAASELGFSSDEAAARTAQGALEAASALGSNEVSEVQEALLEQFIGAALSETRPDTEEQE